MTAAASGGDPGIAREVHPGPEPGLLLVHATGFCKELWRPVVTELRSLGVANRVVAVDQRGHGDSPPPPRPVDWWDLGRDALAVMAGDGGAFGLGVGHSSGGAALAMAEVLAPGTFAALVLIEPVIFPPPFRRDPGSEMAEAARRRKRGFASPAEARANYLGRGPFARWTETAVDLYVAHGMRAEGDSWVLKCEPEVEAEFYASGNAHGVWERLEEVGCPVLIVAGDESPDHWTELTRAQVASFPRARLVTVPGTDHFVPMERPDVVAAAIARVAG